jgi:hypothetical protein
MEVFAGKILELLLVDVPERHVMKKIGEFLRLG